MLIEFSVSNFKSLKDRQVLTLNRMKGDEHEETNTFTKKAFNDHHLLRSSAIYGANASGKSNLLEALSTMKEIVKDSAAKFQRGDFLPVVPFKLDSESRESPAEFEVIFIVDDVRYQYGFSATQSRIWDEWLLAYPKGRAQKWVLRSWNGDLGEYEWDLGNNLLGEKHLWQKSTRDNSLFLSTAVNLNSKQLQPIYDWFKETLRTGSVGGWNLTFSATLCEKDEKEKILNFLKAADLGIEDVNVEAEPFDPNTLPDSMPDAVKDHIANDLKDKKILQIETVHKDSEGNPVTFEIDEESDGTQRLFAFAGPWVDTLENGYVLFIDELHDNLHPKLVKFLVELFHNDKTNPNNAQLVFTTHETSILSQDVFRRDQIWFCEKNSKHETELYPLSDFSPRKGKENLELAYLSGRYGALPFVKKLTNL